MQTVVHVPISAIYAHTHVYTKYQCTCMYIYRPCELDFQSIWSATVTVEKMLGEAYIPQAL